MTRPLQNRVAPTGEIVSNSGRGMLMGNRGCLHGTDRHLGTARWRSKLWICCVLNWKDKQRDPMPPGRWTALFFLDEATALAAGHRPCAYCRRADFLAFAEAWRQAENLTQRPRAAEMDTVLHSQRVESRTRRKLTRPAPIAELPDGAMILHKGGPALLLNGTALPWTFTGYQPPIKLPPATTAELLTPPATIAALSTGYHPMLHPTAS